MVKQMMEMMFMFLRLKNSNGLTAKVMEFGAHLIRLEVPDRDGKLANIVTGFDSMQRYRSAYEGATIGRYANRIANATFIDRWRRVQIYLKPSWRSNGFPYQVMERDGISK